MLKRLALIYCITLSCSAALSRELHGTLVPPPEVCEPGYEKGVSAQFYQRFGRGMIVAGGANFPDIPAAEGGKKVFYKGIYQLKNDKWTMFSQMDEPIAYGASTNGFFVGGANADGASDQIGMSKFRLLFQDSCRKEEIQVDFEKVLPAPIEQCAASEFHIIGGLVSGKPSDGILMFNDSNAWQLLDVRLPHNLVQPIATIDSSFIYLWGGFTPPTGVPVGGWRLNLTTNEWAKIAAPPTGNLTGATLANYDGGFLVVGGVNRDIFKKALLRRERMKTAHGAELERLKIQDRNYMLMPPKKYKFNDRLLFYNPATDRWKTLGRSEHLARAGAAVIVDNDQRLIVTGGELKPGIRNPMTWIFDLKSLTP